ncbi:MAG: hypothetical protein K6E12_10455 [Saccharofermentans sp.]|nr:hypothetical protein [Saccharofermentans sp.]
MTISKRNSLYAVNVIIPLVCGLFIYLTRIESNFLSSSLSGIRSVLPVIRYPILIKNFAADFLWAYSLFFCLRLTLGDLLKGKYSLTVISLTSIVAVVFESLQMIKHFPGTFDPLDIVVELIAVIVAFLISKFIEREVML